MDGRQCGHDVAGHRQVVEAHDGQAAWDAKVRLAGRAEGSQGDLIGAIPIQATDGLVDGQVRMGVGDATDPSVAELDQVLDRQPFPSGPSGAAMS